MIDTIIFIGMAGVGKSSIGHTVAKAFNVQFFDIDTIISEKYHQPLPDIIHTHGLDYFHNLEGEEVSLKLGKNNILSPGGSFIYSTETIKTIQHRCLFIFLHDAPKNILKRIPDLESRGITGLNENKSFEDLYYEREPMYQAIANATFSLEYDSFETVTDYIIEYLKTALPL